MVREAVYGRGKVGRTKVGRTKDVVPGNTRVVFGMLAYFSGALGPMPQIF